MKFKFSILIVCSVMTDEVFPGGLSILSLNPRVTEEFMDDELKQTLVLNGYVALARKCRKKISCKGNLQTRFTRKKA